MARPLSDLIDNQDPGWRQVQGWMNNARNVVGAMPTTRREGEDCLLHLQVTSRSPMGAIALEAAGLLVDRGWIRVLGAGGENMRGSLATWNGLSHVSFVDRPLTGALVIGHDVIGGFFGLNGGAWKGTPGNVFYFGPDTLRWASLDMTYSSWLHWLFGGDLEKFYSTYRWPTWQAEVAALKPDQGFSIYPFLWAKEGGSIENRTRSAVPMTELWSVQHDMAEQLNHLPPGSQVRIDVKE